MTRLPTPHVGTRVLARNAAWNLIAQGLPLLLALVAIPILVRGLGDAGFGVLGLVWMLVTLSGDLGFGRAGTRFAAHALGSSRSHEVSRVARITLSAQALLGVAVGIALVLLAPLLVGSLPGMDDALRAEARRSLLLIAVLAPALTVGAGLRGLLEASQRFRGINTVRFAGSALGYGLPALAVLRGGGLVTVVAILAAIRLAMTVGFAFLASDMVRGAADRDASPGPSVREVLGFGAWTTVSTVVSPMLVYLDRVLLAALVGVAAVGVYTAPFEVVTRLLLVPSSVAATLFPAVSLLQGGGRDAELRRVVSRASWSLLAVVGPPALALALLAGPALRAWLGPTTSPDAVFALQLLVPGVVANALAYVPFSVLQGIGRADVTGRLHLMELPVYAAVAWWLVSRYGVPGAAGAWTLRTVVDSALLFFAAARLRPAAA